MTKSKHETSHAIERVQLDAIRRQAGLPVASSDANWTACSGPSTTLVICQDGSMRGCESASKPLCPTGSPRAAFASQAFADLRQELASGSLPTTHCAGCIHWLQGELATTAPPLRDHSPEADVDRCARGPARLVLRLPLSDSAEVGLTEDLEQLLTELDELVLDASCDRDLQSPIVQNVLSRATALATPPGTKSPATALRTTVRTRADDISAAQQALDGHTIHHLELVFTNGDATIAATTAAMATACGATHSTRFVFTAGNWFQFEEVARVCASTNSPIDLRTLDYDGLVPLNALAADELNLLRDVVASTGSRLTGDDRPCSVGKHAHEQITHELRHVLRTRTLQELAADTELPCSPLRLPPPDHAWCNQLEGSNTDLCDWWHPQLFGRAHLPSVRRWLLESVVSHRSLLEQEAGTWLRTLVQRLAHDQHVTELLELLRELYGDNKQRKALIAYDTAFATAFDLTRYGGPWSESLGLLHNRARKRPFAIKKPTAATDAAPDVTVLIPSFRHETFIEETLQSVLAQRYGNFKVLVVDDLSPDATVARARSIDDARIAVHVNEKNLGLGNSVLQALALVDTPYVALLNSDDLFHPDRLGKCRDVLEQDSTVQLVTTGIQLVDQDGGQLTHANASLVLDGKQVFDWVHWFDRVTPSADLPKEELFAALLERNFLVTSSNLVARTDWLRSQADGLRSLKYCLDWQLFLEAALEGALHHLHEPLIAYRLHASNTVWFREGRRWSYYLEVNRVAAEALQRFLAADRLDPVRKLERVVDSVARHLATNT